MLIEKFALKTQTLTEVIFIPGCIATFAICHCQLPLLTNLRITNFKIQTVSMRCCDKCHDFLKAYIYLVITHPFDPQFLDDMIQLEFGMHQDTG